MHRQGFQGTIISQSSICKFLVRIPTVVDYQFLTLYVLLCTSEVSSENFFLNERNFRLKKKLLLLVSNHGIRIMPF